MNDDGTTTVVCVGKRFVLSAACSEVWYRGVGDFGSVSTPVETEILNRLSQYGLVCTSKKNTKESGRLLLFNIIPFTSQKDVPIAITDTTDKALYLLLRNAEIHLLPYELACLIDNNYSLPQGICDSENSQDIFSVLEQHCNCTSNVTSKDIKRMNPSVVSSVCESLLRLQKNNLIYFS